MPIDATIRRAARWNIEIQQGSTWARTLNFGETPIDSLEFRGQIRRTHDDPEVLAEFSFENLGDNRLAVSLDPASTEAIPAGRHVFDIEAYTTEDEFVARLLEGRADVSPEVTR
ncbi:hypothetical protein [Thioalkalivibrio sp. ALE12]|uniref:hypothetical protein n=1 Tax=Thioalkalivibrio sp. ALE12 TaxID=1158170 RepID=UPI000375BD9F|nr:hypothetical protein [Thioalkalivibrio sp. ALE12]